MTHDPIRRLLVAAMALAALGAFATAGEAQTLRLRQAGTNLNRVVLQVGQVVNIEVFADLQGASASGVAFFITVPDGFSVLDQATATAGTQPFVQGPLFQGAVPASNFLLPETDDVAKTIPGQQLDYSAVLGLGSDRNRTGSGVVARFAMVAVRPQENGQLKIDDNPVRETKLVLSDGVSERRFVTTQGMEITVTGMELIDIPDVILQPGQADSSQIGRLDNYVRNTLSPVDSIRWTFEPSDPDSLEITVDPVTRRVRIVPDPAWRGQVRLIWTATESRAAVPGQPPLSATEVSRIVVNNRPLFAMAPGPDGVKRDTVNLVEDRNTFVPGVTNLDARRAFRSTDLDLLVVDPDVENPDEELNYIVLPLPAGADVSKANVRGDDDPSTHDLLVWSRPDFGGRDSLRVIVQDQLGGRDTLRVIVEVEEVDDAPRILETQREVRISRGGSKRYVFSDFAFDPDTPLDRILLSWVNDPDRHFTADTTRVGGSLVILAQGDPTFTGTGRITFTVRDPLNPEVLFESALFFFTSAEALPPDVFPPDQKVPLSPGSTWTSDLDDYVSDPDNDDSDLKWSVPQLHKSSILVDQDRQITVGAPQDFVGFEPVDLTVADPGGQADKLRLRIYSSDGRPVAGGFPDIVLDRGGQNRQFDLDGYYHDANNGDAQMLWTPLRTFDEDNLTVEVDPLTHVVTFFANERAAFATETVVFRVTDPDGVSATDTVLVTIRSGGASSGGAFQLLPLPPLEAPVGSLVQLIDLHDYVQTSPSLPKSTISWELAEQGNIGVAQPRRVVDSNDPDGVRWILSVFSESSGTDTLQFVATDTLGRSETATTTIRYFGESEVLKLRSIPDIVFIAGQAYSQVRLNDYILDPVTHPDSSINWTATDIGAASGILVQINDDSSVRALSFDIGETRVVFTAHDTVLGVSGRDTVRVIAQDPALAARPLQDLPDIVVQAGGVDSAIVLNDFLPQDVEPAITNWSVSGQSITVPVIDPRAPHRLRLSAVGNSVGIDTLSFRVDLGGGFVATGDMVVTIVEPIDASTLAIEIVPNPLSANFVDFFVLARTQLASSPTVVVSFEGDTTLAVRQIEDDLAARSVLIWAGNYRVRIGASGTLSFRAQALTALGTSVTAQASIALATATSAKAVALRHGGVEVVVPGGAVADEQLLCLQADRASGPLSAARPVAGADLPELILERQIRLYPAQVRLQRPALLRVADPPGAAALSGAGLYRNGADGWRWVGAIDQVLPLERFGLYGVLLDHTPPQVRVEVLEGVLVVGVRDAGSGPDPAGPYAELDGERFDATLGQTGPRVEVFARSPHEAGARTVLVVARDRAGNETRAAVAVVVSVRLPTVAALGAAYPNPFNPETSIPFDIPAGAAGAVRLRVYDAAGQMVRELLNTTVAPGHHRVSWDGRADGGERVGSGVYFYRLEGAGLATARSMTLLK